jgi:hypothetical protein
VRTLCFAAERTCFPALRGTYSVPHSLDGSGPLHERLSMKRFFSVSLAVVIAVCMIVGSERRAWGYVDPGSGLIALQGVASVVAAYAYMVRKRIRAFFVRKSGGPALPAAVKPGDTREIA